MVEKEKNKKINKSAKKEKETQTQQKKQQKKSEEIPNILPPLDFSSLFLPFYTQALISLGQFQVPGKKEEESNLEMAKRYIDLLDLMRKKTKGNLTEEEKALVDNGLHQLKMTYMEKAKIIKL